MNKPFRIVVSLPGEPPRAFEFDSDEVIVGRGDGVTLDLRVPAVSRHECMPSIGAPTSTVATPSSAAVIGPIVLPQGRSERTTKRWGA